MSPLSMLYLAGALQLLQTPAVIAGQRTLGWTQELQRVTPLGRCFVYAIAAGVFCYVTGSGLLTLFFAEAIVTTKLGLGLCVLQATAWGVRAGQQFATLGPVWPQHTRWLHRAMQVTYSLLALLYVVISLRLGGAILH